MHFYFQTKYKQFSLMMAFNIFSRFQLFPRYFTEYYARRKSAFLKLLKASIAEIRLNIIMQFCIYSANIFCIQKEISEPSEKYFFFYCFAFN